MQGLAWVGADPSYGRPTISRSRWDNVKVIFSHISRKLHFCIDIFRGGGYLAPILFSQQYLYIVYLYNIYTVLDQRRRVGRRCINVIQMFCVRWFPNGFLETCFVINKIMSLSKLWHWKLLYSSVARCIIVTHFFTICQKRILLDYNAFRTTLQEWYLSKVPRNWPSFIELCLYVMPKQF